MRDSGNEVAMEDPLPCARRSFENNILAHPVIAVPGYIKKIHIFVYLPIRVISKSVGKRVYNVPRAVSG